MARILEAPEAEELGLREISSLTPERSWHDHPQTEMDFGAKVDQPGVLGFDALSVIQERAPTTEEVRQKGQPLKVQVDPNSRFSIVWEMIQKYRAQDCDPHGWKMPRIPLDRIYRAPTQPKIVPQPSKATIANAPAELPKARQDYYSEEALAPPKPTPLTEADKILAKIEEHGGNRFAAAQALGMSMGSMLTALNHAKI